MRNVFDAFLMAQRGRFALFLPVFFGAGILVYFALRAEPGLGWPLAVTLAAGVLSLVGWAWPVPRALSLCAAFAAGGFSLAIWATARAPAWDMMPRHAVVVTGAVSDIEILPDATRVILGQPAFDGVHGLQRALRIKLQPGDTAQPVPGDVLQVRALVRSPAPPDFPGGWDTQREAFFAGLDGYGFALGKVVVLRHQPANWLADLRAGAARRILASLPGPRGAIAATLLTGAGTAISPDDRAAFQQSGLAHLLAVAGLHIGIVMGLAFGATRLGLALWEYAALHWPTRQMAALAALAAGLFYLAMTGAHVPILRSFAMACLVTLGTFTGRRALSLRGLALAALVLLAAAPHLLVGVSFQMSFAAVLVLIAGYEALRPHLALLGGQRWWRRPALTVAGLALTSLLAGTASLPFAMYHFGAATVYYVPANILAVPITAFWVLPWGMAALALMPLGAQALALVPMGWGIQLLIGIAHAVAAWPGAVLPVAHPPAWGLVLVTAGMVWLCLWRGKLRLAGGVPLVAGLLAPVFVPVPSLYVSPELHLVAVRTSVGVFEDRAPGVTSFELAVPQLLWGVAPSGDLAQAPGVMCTQAACRGALFQLITGDAVPDCTAPVVIARVFLDAVCPGATLFDRAAAMRAGASLVWADGVLTTTAEMRGDRPWVLHQGQLLPMAETE